MFFLLPSYLYIYIYIYIYVCMCVCVCVNNGNKSDRTQIERLCDLCKYIFFLPPVILLKHPSLFKNIFHHLSPDEGLLKPKRFNVDFPLL